MWLKRTKCPDLCQYQEKDDILSGTHTKKIRSSLLGLKHSIKKKKAQGYLSKFQQVGSFSMVQCKGLKYWMAFFCSAISRKRSY